MEVTKEKTEVVGKQSNFKRILTTIGPGLIMAGACIGPSSLTTASKLGSTYGYALLWMVILTVLIRALYVKACYTSAIVLEKPTIEAIRSFYGPVIGIITGITCMFGSVAYQVGNFSGTGIGLNLIFPGLNWKIGGTIMTLLCAYFILGKNIYRTIERFMRYCVLAMVLCFLISLIASGGINAGEAAKGLIPSVPNAAAMLTILAFIGSTCSLPGVAYGTYLGKEKKWTRANLKDGVINWDTAIGVGSIGIVVVMLLSVGAEVLHPQGLTVKTPGDLASALSPVIGKAANYLIGLAFLGAAASSMVANAQMSATLLLSGLGKRYDMESPGVKIVASCVLAFGCVIGIVLGSAPVQTLIIAAACTIIAMPMLGIFSILLLLRKEMGDSRPSNLYIGTLFAAYALLIAVTLKNISDFATKYLS